MGAVEIEINPVTMDYVESAGLKSQRNAAAKALSEDGKDSQDTKLDKANAAKAKDKEKEKEKQKEKAKEKAKEKELAKEKAKEKEKEKARAKAEAKAKAKAKAKGKKKGKGGNKDVSISSSRSDESSSSSSHSNDSDASLEDYAEDKEPQTVEIMNAQLLAKVGAAEVPKIVKITTKQTMVQNAEGVSHNKEEKTEDLTPGGTGAITVVSSINKV